MGGNILLTIVNDSDNVYIYIYLFSYSDMYDRCMMMYVLELFYVDM